MFRIHNKNITAFIARLCIDRIIVIKQKNPSLLTLYPMHVCMYIYMYSHICLFALSSIFKNQCFIYKYTMTNCMYIWRCVCVSACVCVCVRVC